MFYVLSRGLIVIVVFAFGIVGSSRAEVSSTQPATTQSATTQPLSSREQVVEDEAQLMEDMTATLKSVTDETSARAAVPSFDSYRKRLAEWAAAVEQTGASLPELENAVADKYGARLSVARNAFHVEMQRIGGDESLRASMAGAFAKLDGMGVATTKKVK